MSEIVFLILFSFIGGIFSIIMSWKTIKNEEFAKNYMEKSPKGWLWRKILGPERAVIAARKVFAPIGLTIGVLLVLVGIFFIFTAIA
jgi:hypothetical protein